MRSVSQGYRTPFALTLLQALPDDGKRYEIIEGVIDNPFFLVGPAVPAGGGEILPGGVNVLLEGANPVEPGIVVVLPCTDARQVIPGVDGAPDRVIEVPSPSNHTDDLLTKRALYRRGGVRGYWMVDPDDRSIEVVAFGSSEAGDLGTLRGGDKVVPAVLPTLGCVAPAAFAAPDAIASE